jgi:hypothetical protein
MTNVLDIDPHNLKFDFGRDWDTFQLGKVKTFLALYARMRVERLRTSLEHAESLDDMRELQGQVSEARHLLTIIESLQVNDQVNQVLEFIEKYYGR